MYVLNAEKRNLKLKGKQLRKAGFVPGVICGRNIDKSLCLQFAQKEAEQFVKHNSAGSKTEILIGDDKIPAVFMGVSYTPVLNKVEHLNFQAADPEKIKNYVY